MSVDAEKNSYVDIWMHSYFYYKIFKHFQLFFEDALHEISQTQPPSINLLIYH